MARRRYDDPEDLPAAQSEEEILDPEEVVEFEALALEAAADAEVTEEDQGLLQIKAEIERQLFQRTVAASAVGAQAEDALVGAGNIVGVGIGTPYRDFTAAGPGSPVLNVYCVERTDADVVKRQLVDSMGVRAAASDDVNLNIYVTGAIDAQSHRFAIRPAPGGSSVGHVRITAGTLGCLARGRSGERARRVMILSNNHVLANSNNAASGDSIIQPGPADGGTDPASRIAVLERFVNIRFGGQPNLVDCATGWAWHERVRPELMYLQNGQPSFFRVSNQILAARRGMLVGKSGRTTQLTTGRVTDVSATVQVRYGSQVALFQDQIAIQGLNGNFSAGGDSGSLIWTWDTTRNPIGLLFAGGGNVTFANKISRVLDALDINLQT